MKSMTGFGLSEYNDEMYHISVEVKSINHRYKEFSFKLPRKYTALEDNMRKMATNYVSRGKVEISLQLKRYSTGEVALKYDRALAENYKSILDEIQKDFPDYTDDRSISLVAKFPDMVTTEEQIVSIDEIWKKVEAPLKEALEKLSRSRTEEGERLKADFIMRCDLIEKYRNEVEEKSSAIPQAYYNQLMKNISAYTAGTIDEQRLATEMAIYADRCNVTEELVRLSSHLNNFKSIINEPDAIGRKLDFLFQEINREANTIASKSNSFEISTIVVEIKSELEKMREQIQNIE